MRNVQRPASAQTTSTCTTTGFSSRGPAPTTPDTRASRGPSRSPPTTRRPTSLSASCAKRRASSASPSTVSSSTYWSVSSVLTVSSTTSESSGFAADPDSPVFFATPLPRRQSAFRASCPCCLHYFRTHYTPPWESAASRHPGHRGHSSQQAPGCGPAQPDPALLWSLATPSN